MICRPLRRVALVVCVLLFAGCDSATSPDEASVRFVVDDAVPGSDPGTPAIPNSSYTQAANAASAPGVIVVLGRIVLPTQCYELTPDVVQSGGALEITITGRTGAETCAASVVTRAYSLRIGSLHSGMYHVRVIHRVIGASPESSLVLERDVHVD
jgi:hypothetical protein